MAWISLSKLFRWRDKNKLPKPVTPTREEGPRRSSGNFRRDDQQRRDRPEGEQRRRHFNGKKPSGVGAHKGAVSRTGGR